MSKNTPSISNKKQEEAKKKQERLAEALRANLRRRKTQSRVRKEAETDPSKKPAIIKNDCKTSLLTGPTFPAL